MRTFYVFRTVCSTLIHTCSSTVCLNKQSLISARCVHSITHTHIYETAFICCLPIKDSMDCKECNGGKTLGNGFGAIFAFEMKSAVNVSGGIVNEGFTGVWARVNFKPTVMECSKLRGL